MKIDRRLNIVLTVSRDDGPSVFVHSVPISRDIYSANFLLLSKTVSKMYDEGLAPGICSRVGMMMLQKVAQEMGVLDEVNNNLLPEIWRLTNVVLPAETGGWTTLPFQVVMNNKMLDDDDVAEVQNYLCFFTSASWVHKTHELTESLYPILRASGAQLVSSNCTDYASSLPTSTPVETTGATATASSIPT